MPTIETIEQASEQGAAVQAFRDKAETQAAALGLTLPQIIQLFEQLAPAILSLLQLLFPVPPTPTPTVPPPATQP